MTNWNISASDLSDSGAVSLGFGGCLSANDRPLNQSNILGINEAKSSAGVGRQDGARVGMVARALLAGVLVCGFFR